MSLHQRWFYQTAGKAKARVLAFAYVFSIVFAEYVFSIVFAEYVFSIEMWIFIL